MDEKKAPGRAHVATARRAARAADVAGSPSRRFRQHLSGGLVVRYRTWRSYAKSRRHAAIGAGWEEWGRTFVRAPA